MKKRPKNMIKKLVVPSEERYVDPDRMYIEQVLSGDTDAFRHLVARHKEKVRNLIFFTMNTPEIVDDVAQEVFIKVYHKLHKFRFESKFTTWLYRITVNHCKDELRKKKFWKFFSVFDVVHENQIHSNDPEQFDTNEYVQHALSQLPEKLRMPLVLKEIDGFSYKEIAEITDTEMGTVKSRIFRAREALKEILLPEKDNLNK